MKPFFVLHFTFFVFHLLNVSAQDTISVPQDYPTIQQGIDASSDGDFILVDTGTYAENISFNGKAITVASHFLLDGDTNLIDNTIIDGSQPANPDLGSVVTFATGEDSTSVLCGFTITGGTGLIVESLNMRLGGGVACLSSGAKIMNNKIHGNEIDFNGYAGGGGIGSVSEDEENWLVARDNVLSGNHCYSDGIEAYGAGVFSGTNLVFENNEVFENTCTGTNYAEANGAGILLGSQSRTLVFNIMDNFIHDNSCDGYTVSGAGVMLWFSEGIFYGNDVWYNSGTAVNIGMGGGVNFIGATGVSYLAANDLFANSLEGYHLQGGGLDVGSGNDTIYVINNRIDSNELTASYATWGGGISLNQDQEVLICDNLIQNNITNGAQGNQGASVWVEDAQAKVEFKGNIFNSNSAQGHGYGGGIGFFNDYQNQVPIEIEGNIFVNNAMRYGGAICTFNSYDMQIVNNVFYGNTAADDGGAIILRHYAKGRSDILTSTARIPDEDISNNGSRNLFDQPVIVNNTFFGNTSGSGGAIYCDEDDGFAVPIIFNSIFWQNQADLSGDDIYYDGNDTLLLAYCNIDTSSNIYGNWEGTGNINEDPGFIDDSCHIDGSSPCLNIGADSLGFGGTWYYCPAHDLNGNDRPFPSTYCDPVPDIGAYEIEFDCTAVEEFKIQNSEFNISCFPNPTRGIYNVQFTMYSLQSVSLKIYDLHGREVAVVLDEKMPAGEHVVFYDMSGLSEGIYFVRLTAGGEVASYKIVKIR